MESLRGSERDVSACGDVIDRDVTGRSLSDSIFESEGEMRASLSRFCYGDLYIIGSIWIHALRAMLVGAKFSLFPVVEAKPDKPPDPERPPKMRYKDLPIYKSPHYEYKDFVSRKDKCPEANTKLLHKALLPYVKIWRKKILQQYCSLHCGLKGTCRDIAADIGARKNNIKKTMRDPNNLLMRQAVFAGGSIAGYLIGRGGPIRKRLFFTSLGALATGALCFPKETDEIFRDTSYHAAKMILMVYNGLCKKDRALRERVPCKDDLPAEPKPRKPLCQTK